MRGNHPPYARLILSLSRKLLGIVEREHIVRPEKSFIGLEAEILIRVFSGRLRGFYSYISQYAFLVIIGDI